MDTPTPILAAVLASLLVGCTLAPKCVAPESPAPEAWPSGPAYQDASGGSGPRVAWREFLADPRLAQVVELALAKNRDLRLAALHVERARALYGIQRHELYPAVYASGGGGRQRASADLTAAGQPRTTEQYSANLGVLSWEIDFFGRIRSLAEEARQSYLATEQARRSAQILLVSAVAEAYLALAADREGLALAEETLAAQQASYDLVRRQYDAHVATELDLRRAQTPLETARGEIARYTQQVAQDRNALDLLAGAPVPDGLLPSSLGQVVPPREISAGLPSEVLLARPDVMGAEHRLRGAHAFVGAARAAFFPSISLTAALGTASDELSGLFHSHTGAWSYAAQSALPIFDARTWSAYRVSKAQREIAVAEYERVIQNAFREVADALAACGTMDRRIAAQEALVAALAEVHRLSLLRFEQGIDGYLGVLDAQRSLFSAQQGLVSLRLARLASRVRLYAALGGGGEPLDPASDQE